VLTPESTPREFAQTEQALGLRGAVAPPAASYALRQWRERGPQLLLKDLPRFLNPGVAASDLNPTGRSTRELFPAFYRLLDSTREIAVLADVSHTDRIFLAGLLDGSDDEVPLDWAYGFPPTLEELAQWERAREVRLSPQMRQIYLHAGGVPYDWVCPYFFHLERLQPGYLLTDVYSYIFDPIPWESAVIEDLQRFVPIGGDATGDWEGFFAGEERADDEYTIYSFSVSTTFTPVTQDFSSFVSRKINWEPDYGLSTRK
jgi:hypothetical protein